MKLHIVNHSKSLIEAVDKSLEGLSIKMTLSERVEDAVDEIRKHGSDIVLINWTKGDFDCLSLCKNIRRLKLSEHVHIIVILTRELQGRMSGLFNAGADDFIMKPFSKDELDVKFQIASRILKLHDASKKTRKNLIKYSKEDTVTNLLNRRALLDEGLKEMGRISREKKFLSAFITSITNFEEIVDLHGDAAGGEVLQEFARRVKASFRPYDKIGRFGIVEFLVFIPGSTALQAEKAARRILPAVVDKPFTVKGMEISIETNTGISELDPKDIARNHHVDDHLVNDLILEALIRRAEMAMGKAGKSGNNKIQMFNYT